ncbi:hypothetical protein IFM89_001463 [Coptis chinensis]|uniref:Uncharacterized protein n=1 Tax=Coptis chinensis TaxID=261450 RepID=A0A835L9S7_9MAGN|nr:hypothetical protein IFM89_001463 [Coptis chinensis]
MEVNNTQDSSVERTGRGAVQCKRITKMREGELLNVQYNEDGQHIGEGGKDLASYSGLLAESRISIVNYENWHAVGDEVRDLLWDTIKAKFNLTEDEKKGVVSDIGEKWKEFKSRLTSRYPSGRMQESTPRKPSVLEESIKEAITGVVKALAVSPYGVGLTISSIVASSDSSRKREGLHRFISRSRSNIQKLDLRLPENCVLSTAVLSSMVHSDGIQKLDLRLPENYVLSDERVFSLLVFISVLSDAVENGDGA